MYIICMYVPMTHELLLHITTVCMDNKQLPVTVNAFNQLIHCTYLLTHNTPGPPHPVEVYYDMYIIAMYVSIIINNNSKKVTRLYITTL